jgi:integrase
MNRIKENPKLGNGYHPSHIEISRLRKDQKRYVEQLFRKIIKQYGNEYIFDDARIKNVPYKDDWRGKRDEQLYKNASTRNWNALQSIQKYLGIGTNLSSHVSRHTSTQILLDSGVSIHDMSEYLTHTNMSTTERYRRQLGTNTNTLGHQLLGLFKF